MLGRPVTTAPATVQRGRVTVEKLPWSVVRRLTQLLDQSHPEHHSWSSLLSHAEVIGVHYTADEVANFQTVANRAVGSPSEAVLQDLMVRCVTTDELYLVLKDMGHKRGMELLEDYVSIHLLPKKDDTVVVGGAQDGGGGASERPPIMPHHQYHPEIGPLPINVPNTIMGTTVIHVPQDHTHQLLHDYHPTSSAQYYTHHHSSSSSSPSSQYLNHTPSPNQSGYFFQGTTPTAQFSSPPPPPYSPQSIHSSFPSHPHPPLSHPPSDHVFHDIPHGQRIYDNGGTSSSSSSPPRRLSPVFIPSAQPPLSPWGEGPLDPGPRTVSSNDSITDPSSTNPTPSSVGGGANSSENDFKLSILRFSYADLSTATRIFTEGLVGHGAFGSVFKANVRGCGPYAIKKLHNRSEMQSEMDGTLFFEPLHQESFMLELQSLVKYKHRNILSLVAISDDGPRPCLVYEYIENGSLADCLLGKKNVQLNWKLRLEIASQVGDALNFLHRVNEPQCLIHGDVKSSNILLDRHLTPKLSDFGLARECLSRSNHVTTVSANSRVAMGTVAYMAPEFLRNSKPSSMTDVYAFGVVMLELFTGQAADDPSRDIRTLVYHLQPLFNDPDKNREMVLHESDVRARWPSDTALGFFVIATFCLQRKPKSRPPMDQVRDQITMLLDEAVIHQPMGNLHISSSSSQYT